MSQYVVNLKRKICFGIGPSETSYQQNGSINSFFFVFEFIIIFYLLKRNKKNNISEENNIYVIVLNFFYFLFLFCLFCKNKLFFIYF